jgi:hypothetical protein
MGEGVLAKFESFRISKTVPACLICKNLAISCHPAFRKHLDVFKWLPPDLPTVCSLLAVKLDSDDETVILEGEGPFESTPEVK